MTKSLRGFLSERMDSEHIVPSEKFTQLLKTANNMPLSINASALKKLLELPHLAVNQFSKQDYINNNVIKMYFKVFYFVDLKSYHDAIVSKDPM